MKRTALLTLLLATSNVQAVEVLATIKPLEMIVHELIVDGDSTSTLLHGNASPHDYALKPSDLTRLKEADLVVWFGEDLETFLVKPISRLNTAVTLQEQESIELREFGKKCGCGAHHSSHDPHVWLGPKQARQIAKVITEKLIELNPTHAASYKAKLMQFNFNMTKTVDQIQGQLAPFKQEGYFVFHDAYGYFEDYFNTNKLGHFTVEPERKPGAKTLIKIKTTIRDKNVKCVFTEPQFTPAVIESTVRGTNAKIGQLDPLGVDIEVADRSYFRFLQSISKNLTNCLAN
ncbi:high-affinity zinc uptake system protein ZnuA [Vibrio orientalis CIP 102891 = ATCC 33934]|uniref:High-affinity zinc uptake system protein ZnuA n=1 Tax=Vibrio orientalis CIP 102891 = ATCC 33934 TaxID=675816 RepID=C9QGR2_VIBOR|nr:zinc ABC transporter substrate-binding protein ZnuA [Vibrio orientalis]EEX93773.1 zinc ABC transporter-binding protein ZnuA [Vibrio orientalis CIP 102891 = ATCC 33934]EGU50781.1 high-affinity zinc uptake system protein ZnuA [Vibrio orientalis CIP 102891 = ATCC 33934]